MLIRSRVLLYIAIILFLAGCSASSRLITGTPHLPGSAEAKYRMAVDRNNGFSALTIRNIHIKLQTPDRTNRLNAALKMHQDSAILLSLRAPLGIELSRILYTRDSVKMVDRQNKTVHISNYQNLSGLLPVELNYGTLQAIFTGNIPRQYKTLDFAEPGTYNNKSSREVYLGTYAAPAHSGMKNFYGWIYKDIIRPSHLVFYEKNSVDQLRIHYEGYDKTENCFFPEEVKIDFDDKRHNSRLSIKMGQYTLQHSVDMELGIPASYKTIRH